jgi:hypothetical protein
LEQPEHLLEKVQLLLEHSVEDLLDKKSAINMISGAVRFMQLSHLLLMKFQFLTCNKSNGNF